MITLTASEFNQFPSKVIPASKGVCINKATAFPRPGSEVMASLQGMDSAWWPANDGRIDYLYLSDVDRS